MSNSSIFNHNEFDFISRSENQYYNDFNSNQPPRTKAIVALFAVLFVFFSVGLLFFLMSLGKQQLVNQKATSSTSTSHKTEMQMTATRMHKKD